jgi:hypothetical protein
MSSRLKHGEARMTLVRGIGTLGLLAVLAPDPQIRSLTHWLLRRRLLSASGRFASKPKTITRRLLGRKAKEIILPGPFGRQIDEASYPHPVREPPVYGGSDQTRREECKGDRHIHLADAAALSFRDAFRACR